MPKTAVIIPTYNERENIGALVRAIFGLEIRGLEVLVVDDSSPDGTAEAVRTLQREFPDLKLLVRTGPAGRGLAGREGFLECLKMGADYVIEMDGDFSHDPRHIPALLAAMERCDLAVGSRRVPGGSDERVWPRVWLTRAANAYARALLGAPVLDMNSGFRCFNRRALEAVRPETLRSTGPSIVHEALIRVRRAGLRVEEIPIVFRDRSRGATKLKLWKLACGFLWILRLRFHD
jgi:dolichol-phosphate mannosyltransferase